MTAQDQRHPARLHRRVQVVEVAVLRARLVADQGVERVGELELRSQVAIAACRQPRWYGCKWQWSPDRCLARIVRNHLAGESGRGPGRGVLPVLLAGPGGRPALQDSILARIGSAHRRRHEAESEQAIEGIGCKLAIGDFGRGCLEDRVDAVSVTGHAHPQHARTAGLGGLDLAVAENRGDGVFVDQRRAQVERLGRHACRRHGRVRVRDARARGVGNECRGTAMVHSLVHARVELYYRAVESRHRGSISRDGVSDDDTSDSGPMQERAQYVGLGALIAERCATVPVRAVGADQWIVIGPHKPRDLRHPRGPRLAGGHCIKSGLGVPGALRVGILEYQQASLDERLLGREICAHCSRVVAIQLGDAAVAERKRRPAVHVHGVVDDNGDRLREQPATVRALGSEHAALPEIARRKQLVEVCFRAARLAREVLLAARLPDRGILVFDV